MDNKINKWAWKEAKVDRGNDHIVLSYGKVSTSEPVELIEVALLGTPVDCVFPVEFLNK
jgi:hypothetical protein